MKKIHLLPVHEAQKIAAGEVIERPAHIIKELLENSLDAGATAIDIYLEEAGKKLIRIVDNGCGMSVDDARLCFVKHATSKISTLDDLETISSFGFRGEALASIAAVSKTILKTKPHNEDQSVDLGVTIAYEQGAIIQEQPVACQTGTEFIARELFYNMPARRKFLRQDETEVNQVQQLIYATALSHLSLHIRFFVDDKIILNAPGCKTVQERVTQLWGYNTAQQLLTMTTQTHEKHTWLTISGAISTNSFWRHSRDRIFFFVNNRWIKDQELSKALLKGYAQSLPPGKFPMAFIFISLEPGYVDINVHPKKEEVRFLKPGIVEALLQKGVQATLEGGITQLLTQSQPSATQENEAVTPVFSLQSTGTSPREHTTSFGDFSLPPFFQSTSLQRPVTFNAKPQPQLVEETMQTLPEQVLDRYKIVGQVFNTYIMLEKKDELIMIDQHAAHERVLYEQWKSSFERISGVALLFPEVITIPEHHLALIMGHHEIFNRLGISLEPFGKREILLKTSPPKIQSADLSTIIKEAAVFLEEHDRLDPDDIRKQLYEHTHSHMACKAAVRAGDELTTLMMTQLINDLLTVDNRFQCVHGRPTMWVIPKSDVEKKFRRC